MMITLPSVREIPGNDSRRDHITNAFAAAAVHAQAEFCLPEFTVC